MWEQFHFALLERAGLLFLIPLIMCLFVYSFYRKKKFLEKFSSPSMYPILLPNLNIARQKWKASLILLSIFFFILTLMRPQGDPQTTVTEKKGRDLIFVIDVSRSMLAEDMKPNRLERAKQLVRDVIDILQGDRVGLVIFAGTAAIKCPLTLDYFFFLNALEKIGPHDINAGGTHIGDSIRLVTERMFLGEESKYQDVILITDGEDHDSFPLEAAKLAQEKNIQIHTVGLGDPNGTTIPVFQGNGYDSLQYNNQTVQTRLDEKTLKEIARITNGIFVPVQTRLVNLSELYQKYIAAKEKRKITSKTSQIWQELYQFFLIIGIFLLILEMFIGERSGWKQRKKQVI